jgi:hypothetical protein
MDDFEEILNGLSAKPGRSRFEPYGSLIDKLLRSGRTYREIAGILAEKCHVHIAFSTIHHFVRKRSRAKRKASQRVRPNIRSRSKSRAEVRNEEKEGPAAEMIPSDDVYQRIAALKKQPASPPETAKVFHYDPDEPLHLHEKIKPMKSGK